ncbi:MAG: hypothetical protein GC192_17245 [Bacteroidetes bacterium]|nr:hypothetical protein [Bacteroidota bacterium]
MKPILPILYLIISLPCLQAQDFSGQYNGEYNGDAVQLTLESAGTSKWSGVMTDSEQTYKITATSQGKDLSGKAACEALGISLDLSGRLNGNVLDLKMSFMGVEMPVALQRSGTTKTPTTNAPSGKTGAMPKLPANAKHDPALVGTWERQENYNSGAGMDGYYSNSSFLAFNADGTLSDLGGETMVGSNAGSGRAGSGGSGIVPGVKWYTENKGLFLVATDGVQTETARLGRYYIENGTLLITADNGTKQLFYKRN